MILKIILSIVIGGSVGFGLSYLLRGIGSSWAFTCNPYISTPLGALVGLLIALG